MEEKDNEKSYSFSSLSNEFRLKLTIPSYELSSYRSEYTVYKVELTSEISYKTWHVFRKLSEFQELHSIFLKFFIRVPYFPQSIPENTTKDLEIRKSIIEKYLKTLKELLRRPDFINSIHLKNFLELDNHFQDFHLFQPLVLFEIFDLPLSINNFNFSKKNNLLFVGLANNTSYASKIYSLFGFYNSNRKEEQYEGGLSINHLSKNYCGEIHVEQIIFKGYSSPVSCINVMDEDDIVAIGLNDGTIYLYKINLMNYNHKLKNELCEEISCIKAHHYKIVNVAIQYSTGYIFSCAEEGVLVISEMNYQSVMKVFEVTKNVITCMTYDKDNNRIYITDDGGTIWIISVKNLPPMILQAIGNQIPNITCLDVNLDKNFIFIGNNAGRVIFYDYDDHDLNDIVMEKRLEILSDYNLIVKKINFKSSKNELIISYNNGSIGIYSYEEEYPEFVIDSHLKEINSTFWDEDNKILITSSTDNRIKIWQLPISWPSEMMRNKDIYNKTSIITDNSLKSLNIVKLKEAFLKEEDNDNVEFDLSKESKNLKEAYDEQQYIETNEKEEKVELRYEIKTKQEILILKDDLLGWDL